MKSSKRYRKHLYRNLIVVMLIVRSIQPISAQTVGSAVDCGLLENAYGPFDYTNPNDIANKLNRVERAHYDEGVRALRGHLDKVFTWTMLSGDLDYTLRAFPNHHHALYTMAQYHLREYDKKHVGMRYSAYCYFERAKRNSPQDGNVHVVEGIYLSRLGRMQEAESSYLSAIELMPNSAEAHYNLGLLYLDLKNYAAAREQAKVAYELGYPMPGLRNRLKKIHQWEN